MISLTSRTVIFLVAASTLLLSPPKLRAESQTESIPLHARRILSKTRELIEECKYKEAAERLQTFKKKGGKLKPNEADKKGFRHYLIHFTLGNCYLMTENLKESRSCYRASVAANPHFHAGWMNLAKCCYEMNDYSGAGQAFLKGYQTGPVKDPEILYHGAVCFIAAENSKRALGFLERLFREYPLRATVKWREAIVRVYFSLNQPRKALPFIEHLSEDAEGNKKKQWQEIRLQQYIVLNMEKEALGYGEQLTRDDPLEAKWWKGLAHLHLKKKRYRPALVALNIKGLLEPLTRQEQITLADLNMTVGIPVQAIRCLTKIAKDNLTHDIACRIIEGYSRLHKPEKALKWVDMGLQKGNNPRILMLKGNLLYEQGKFQKASAAFELAALSKKEGPGKAWLMAGYAAWEAKDLQKAHNFFKNAARCGKQKAAAQKALRQLNRNIAPITK